MPEQFERHRHAWPSNEKALIRSEEPVGERAKLDKLPIAKLR